MPRKCSHGEGSYCLNFCVCVYVGTSANALHQALLNEKGCLTYRRAVIPVTRDGWDSVRSEIPGQGVVGMRAYRLCWLLQTGNEASCYTGWSCVWPQKQWELRRNASIIQLDSLYVCKYLCIILEGLLIALWWSQTQLYWESVFFFFQGELYL